MKPKSTSMSADLVIETLRESEKKFRTLFENSSVGMLFTGLDGRFIDVNQAFLKLVDYKADALLGLTVWDLVSEPSLTRKQELRQRVKTGAFGPEETLILSQKGKLIPSLLSGSAIAYGGSKSIFFVVQDITERKRKEAILLESIGDGVVAIDRSWNITLTNKAACELSGWSAEEVLNKPFRKIFSLLYEKDRTENISFIEQAMLKGQARQMENKTVLVRKDGTEMPVGDSAAPIFDREGQVIGAIIIFRDATKEREVMRLRSDFTYASHQLRTPVNQALWSIEAAMSETDPAQTREKMNVALFSVQSVKKLADQLLIVSEVDQQTIAVKVKSARLVDILEAVSKRVEAEAKAKKIAIKLPTVSLVAGVTTDENMLSKAVYEVVQNAVLYSPSGSEVEIRISTKNGDVLFEIGDSGIGIPESQHPLIFTKFFRGQNIPPESVGAGLGLYIAHEYVGLLGGKIWFKSIEGKGSTFYISIPAK